MSPRFRSRASPRAERWGLVAVQAMVLLAILLVTALPLVLALKAWGAF